MLLKFIRGENGFGIQLQNVIQKTQTRRQIDISKLPL